MVIVQLMLTSSMFVNFPGQLDGEDMRAQVTSAECCISEILPFFQNLTPIDHIAATETSVVKGEPASECECSPNPQ